MGSYFNVDDAGHLNTISIESTPIGTATPAPVHSASFKCNQKVFSNMDAGLASVGTVSYGSITSITVNTTSTFSAAPTVICTPTAGAVSDANIAKISCGIHNVSISQFQLNCTINDSAASPISSVDVAWFAFE